MPDHLIAITMLEETIRVYHLSVYLCHMKVSKGHTHLFSLNSPLGFSTYFLL